MTARPGRQKAWLLHCVTTVCSNHHYTEDNLKKGSIQDVASLKWTAVSRRATSDVSACRKVHFPAPSFTMINKSPISTAVHRTITHAPRFRVHWNIGDSSAACRHTMGSVPWQAPCIRYGKDLLSHSAWIYIFSHLTSCCFILRHIPFQLSSSGVSQPSIRYSNQNSFLLNEQHAMKFQTCPCV